MVSSGTMFVHVSVFFSTDLMLALISFRALTCGLRGLVVSCVLLSSFVTRLLTLLLRCPSESILVLFREPPVVYGVLLMDCFHTFR